MTLLEEIIDKTVIYSYVSAGRQKNVNGQTRGSSVAGPCRLMATKVDWSEIKAALKRHNSMKISMV
jgi:hypothetical protein